MAGQPVPSTLITTPFAASATNINAIPINPPSNPALASFLLGWQAATEQPLASGGVPPRCEDFNGILNAITQGLAYLQAGQNLPYNSTIATAISGYAQGAIIRRADGTGSWINTTSGNTTNPDSGGINWMPTDNYGLQQFTLTNANVTLSGPQAAKSIILLQGTLTGNVQLTFPTWLGMQWLIINGTTGPYALTATTSGGTPIAIAQGGAGVLTWCDGTNLNITNIGPQASSFTITAAAGGTILSGSTTCNYTRVGNTVTMTLPALTFTSTGTSFAMFGIPTALIPPSYATIVQEFPIANALNDSAWVAGASCYLNISSGTPEIVFMLNGSPTGWSGSGTKYCLGNMTYNVGL
jgi:hypothetical protein